MSSSNRGMTGGRVIIGKNAEDVVRLGGSFLGHSSTGSGSGGGGDGDISYSETDTGRVDTTDNDLPILSKNINFGSLPVGWTRRGAAVDLAKYKKQIPHGIVGLRRVIDFECTITGPTTTLKPDVNGITCEINQTDIIICSLVNTVGHQARVNILYTKN